MAHFTGTQLESVEIDDSAIKAYAEEEFSIDELFSDSEIKSYITDHFEPDDIFSERQLSDWAEENGYIKG